MRRLICLLILILTGCSSLSESDRYQASRYHQDKDSAPVAPPELDHVPDAVPQYEPKSAGGNDPVYKVLGKKYQVLESEAGFSETGYASWYGQKFHGHKTSNGEIYDMYKMSAAHKHLPLPSYVKVTRLDNQKQVIVRVNDRGPFHTGRIIDLSYAAAYKLGMLKNGTAPVKIEAITTLPPWKQPLPPVITQTLPSPSPVIAEKLPVNRSQVSNHQQQLYLQVTVTGDQAKADHLVSQLGELFEVGARKVKSNQLYKVQLGPFSDEGSATQLLERLKLGEFSSTFRVYGQ